MIVGSSAVLAILFDEKDAKTFARILTEADSCRMSAANFVEVAIVVEAQTRDSGSRQFDALMDAAVKRAAATYTCTYTSTGQRSC